MHNHEKGFALSVQQSNESLLLQDLTDGVIDIAMVTSRLCENHKFYSSG